MTNCEYVRRYYGVPAEVGRRLMVYGQPAIISADRGHHIGITYDKDKPGVLLSAHPIDGVEYLGMGLVRPMTPGQRRYRKWIEVADCFPDWKFGDWLKSTYAREIAHD